MEFGHLSGIHLYLMIMLEKREFLEGSEMPNVRDCIDLIIAQKYYPAYFRCGRMLHFMSLRK
jgi:hypothetical protein